MTAILTDNDVAQLRIEAEQCCKGREGTIVVCDRWDCTTVLRILRTLEEANRHVDAMLDDPDELSLKELFERRELARAYREKTR